MSKKSIGSKTLKVGASLLALGAGVAAVNAKTKNNTEKKKIREIQKNIIKYNKTKSETECGETEDSGDSHPVSFLCHRKEHPMT